MAQEMINIHGKSEKDKTAKLRSEDMKRLEMIPRQRK